MTEDDLTIPDFLRISSEDRKAAWKDFVPKAVPETTADARQRELRERHAADRDAKRKASLEKFKEKHELETWNETLGIWERDEAKIVAYNKKLEEEMS